MQKKLTFFSAHFEKTDAAQVKFDHVAAQGVCAVEPRVDSFVGEFTNYSSDNPVSVNKELTYGSASETEKALIDGRIATKLCAVSTPDCRWKLHSDSAKEFSLRPTI